MVVKVEPIRVLADDEIGVRRPGYAKALRDDAASIRRLHGSCEVAHWLDEVADALEAEATP
jgi:hypothetical protein